jgi:predicted CXXCH cytochrome family protein
MHLLLPSIQKGGTMEGMLNKYSVLIFIVTAFFVTHAEAGNVVLSDEAQACLECHSKRGIIKTFENKESLEAYVEAEKFGNSVHNTLKCSDCHTDFSGEEHPQRRFRSKEQYKIKAALSCRKCHQSEQISTIPIHARLLSEEESGSSHPCTNCHGSHAIKPISRKIYKNEEQYCLNCHGYNLTMGFRNGETLPLTIDISSLETSVHNRISCSDCHFGFSHSSHPQRNFRSKRDFRIANSETCRRCHFDKYTKTMDSIHYIMLGQGNLDAPVCTDCHGSHSILHLGKERTPIAKRCQKCHAGIYDIYVKSVHGKALFDEHNQDVPVCIDCHTAHDIKNPLTLDYREQIPDMCSNCHANKAIINKYGLSTDVAKSYLSNFHGVTLLFYRKQREELNKPAKQIAVCTDCHGTHNIISTRSTDPSIVKANLVKRCRQCHEGATENFPDAWLSHYKPTLASAPLVFIINQAYGIFIPVMVIGIVLQILLHIWRYTANK